MELNVTDWLVVSSVVVEPNLLTNVTKVVAHRGLATDFTNQSDYLEKLLVHRSLHQSNSHSTTLPTKIKNSGCVILSHYHSPPARNLKNW